VNTIHRYLAPIDQKYPGSLKMIHQEGTVEKAQLYELDYSKMVPAATSVPNTPQQQ
jgi:hypothetical protein